MYSLSNFRAHIKFRALKYFGSFICGVTSPHICMSLSEPFGFYNAWITAPPGVVELTLRFSLVCNAESSGSLATALIELFEYSSKSNIALLL